MIAVFFGSWLLAATLGVSVGGLGVVVWLDCGVDVVDWGKCEGDFE